VGGPLRFQNIVFTLDDCPPLDEGGPVIAELTARGDLVIHNWDRDVDEAGLALGLERDDLPCMALEKGWEEIVGFGRLQLLHNLPVKVRSEVKRIIGEIENRGMRALKLADYMTPSQKTGVVGYEAKRVHLHGLNPSEHDFITAQVKKMFFPGMTRDVTTLPIEMYITVQGYMDVQNLIRDGVVVDQRRKKLAVVGIDDVFDDDSMAVRIGYQRRDMSIATRPAIIKRVGRPKKKTWELSMWL
jgi:hypothetical protein